MNGLGVSVRKTFVQAAPLPLGKVEHITALPRNYTWHPLRTAILKSITARLQPTPTLLTFIFFCDCSVIAHKLSWYISDSTELNEPCVKRRRQSRGLCTVLLSFCLWVPKVFPCILRLLTRFLMSKVGQIIHKIKGNRFGVSLDLLRNSLTFCEDLINHFES